MIQLKDFTIGFENRRLLDNVSTSFRKSKLTALIGRNGTGKSTLLKAICGLNDDYKGEILIDGENIRKIPRNRFATLLAYVNTQRPRMSNLRCKEVVALGRSPYTGWNGKLSEEDFKIVDKAIDLVGMKGYENRYFNSLSDGESQKIMIARAIAQDTKIIILDEPTSFLDLPMRHELVEILKELTIEEKKTILFSTHELDVAIRLCDYIGLIDAGKIYNLPVKEMVSFIKDTHHSFESFL